MATYQELIALYGQQTTQLAEYERLIEEAKRTRSELAGQLFRADGKGKVYDVGGVQMIVSTTKIGTYFLTPKDKWKKSKVAKMSPKAAVAELTRETQRLGGYDFETEDIRAEALERGSLPDRSLRDQAKPVDFTGAVRKHLANELVASPTDMDALTLALLEVERG